MEIMSKRVAMKWLFIVSTSVILMGCQGSKTVFVGSAPVSASQSVVDESIEPGTFTSAGLAYCTNGSCTSFAVPASCSSASVFADFTILDQATASFFGSIFEQVAIDHELKQITLVTNNTTHQGLTIGFKYHSGPDRWEITYGPNCGRLYKKV
jgi:hypothetical protein